MKKGHSKVNRINLFKIVKFFFVSSKKKLLYFAIFSEHFCFTKALILKPFPVPLQVEWKSYSEVLVQELHLT